MKAIIFGINGQDGYYLKNLLDKNGLETIGVSRRGKFINGSVGDIGLVKKLIQEHTPDYIFHFAANSTTRHDTLFENHDSIATGSLNILESCYKYSKNSRIFLSGSAVQFENKGTPINEKTPFAPLSPYAVARIQSVYAGRYYRNLGLAVYVGYFFNHDSPLRTNRHINQKIALAVQRIAKGSNEKIEIGNSMVQKEFNYAGDMMRAIWKFVNQSEIYEAVIGSGKAYSILNWIETCFSIIGKSPEGYIVQKNNFKTEYDILVSDPKRLFSIGYRPQFDINTLAELMIKK